MALDGYTRSARVGYAEGAGGAVTQESSASTGVTINKATGRITTVALTTAGAAEETFTVTNSEVAADDVVNVTITGYAGAGTPVAFAQVVAAGSFKVIITNLSASALDDPVVINFAVIKGAVE